MFSFKNIAFNTAIKKRLLAKLSQIMEEEGADKENEAAEKNILDLTHPNYWSLNIRGNIEVDMELKFESLLLSVSKNTTEDMKKITTFRFYNLIKNIKESNIKKT